jgi:mono/diheme cytochrome c family protein
LTGKRTVSAVVLLAAFVLVGCRQDMHDQPKIEPLEANAFFADGMGARPKIAGTVARGQLFEDTRYYTGKDESGAMIDELPEPMELSRELLVRGQNRYEVYCTPCHDSTGSGRGMIVRRGFKQPPAYTDPRLMSMPLGYFFDVMTQGFGVMSPYAKQVPVEDRWAIAAYVRVLQVAQGSVLEELPSELQEEFQTALTAPEAPPEEGGHH